MIRLVTCVLALAPGAAHAAPVPKGLAPPFLVVLKPDKHSQVFLADADGTNSKALTDGKSNASYPAWSPDGKTIAFCSDRTGVMNVFVMDADGKNTKPLTEGNVRSRAPAWSPDGNTILCCRDTVQGTQEICSLPAAGGAAKVIDCGGDGWDPAWSPDGKRIAFVSYREGRGWRLYAMDADGKNVVKLTDTPNNVGLGYPAWSRDGKNIAYADLKDGALQVFTVGADGKNLRQLTTERGRATYPDWSFDDKRLLFYQWTTGDAGRYCVMDADGKNVKVLMKDAAVVEGGRPQWRPR